ncbi:MAG: response regulator transcription factor [Nitrospirae bacterium]|nr:response regulator transcription factor [Nitrospirota bacterium]
MNGVSEDTIIICTDDDGLNGLIASILGPEGFTLISALNQRMIFSLIETYMPVAVIADSGLPEIMGKKTWRIIKGIERFSDTRIILVTGNSMQQEKDEIEHVDEVIEIDLLSTGLLPAVYKYCSHGIPCKQTDGVVQLNEDASRLARAIVSDIIIYNSDAAYKGAADGTFYDILKDEIEKGMAIYRQRFCVHTNPPDLPDYFNDAIRDFISKTQQCNLVLP